MNHPRVVGVGEEAANLTNQLMSLAGPPRAETGPLPIKTEKNQTLIGGVYSYNIPGCTYSCIGLSVLYLIINRRRRKFFNITCALAMIFASRLIL